MALQYAATCHCLPSLSSLPAMLPYAQALPPLPLLLAARM
jgi:hypothetical protein